MNTTTSKTELTASTQEPVVYVVDDMPQVLDVVRMILEKEGYNILTFQSGKEFLSQKEISEIGCVLLDNQMPEMTGLDVQAELIKRGSSTPIIFISGASRYEEVVDAVRGGARHFLQKPFTHSELTTLVKEAIDESRKRQVQLSSSAKYKAFIKNLTLRESQVYQLVTDGLTNRVISEKLDISNGTVEFHRANMMKKLEAKTLAELMEIKHSLEP
jgi:two-component system, LuxR family, response regulator FixJ